jgi:hypothetical protein
VVFVVNRTLASNGQAPTQRRTSRSKRPRQFIFMFISSKIRIAWEDKRELRKQCKKEVPERNISRKCGCCVEELAKMVQHTRRVCSEIPSLQL